MNTTKTRTRPPKSDIVCWKDDLEECFTFLFYSWNVSAAKTILKAKPRKIERVEVSVLEPFLGRTIQEADGKYSIRLGIAVDEARAERDATIDLSIPLIAVVTPAGNALPIDGWHRVARAFAQGVLDLPIVYLTKRESASVQY